MRSLGLYHRESKDLEQAAHLRIKSQIMSVTMVSHALRHA